MVSPTNWPRVYFAAALRALPPNYSVIIVQIEFCTTYFQSVLIASHIHILYTVFYTFKVRINTLYECVNAQQTTVLCCEVIAAPLYLTCRRASPHHQAGWLFEHNL